MDNDLNITEDCFSSEHPFRLLISALWGENPAAREYTINTYGDTPSAQETGRVASKGMPRKTFTETFPLNSFPLRRLRAANEVHLAIGWVPNPKDAVYCIYAEIDGGGRFETSGWSGPHPDAIVRSKNGDHLYWRVDPATTVEAATAAMRAITIALRGDPAIGQPHHVMRLPGFLHQKNPSDPYMVTIEHVEPNPKPHPLKAFGAATQAEWSDYVAWCKAVKAGVTGIEYGSPEWVTERRAAMAFVAAREAYTRLSYGIKGYDLRWVPGRSAKWWWSLQTQYRLVQTVNHWRSDRDQMRAVFDLLGDKGQACLGADASESPDWLSVEPALRVWVAAAEQTRKDWDGEDQTLESLPPFDLDSITPEQIAAIPEPGSAQYGQGAYDLKTVDWAPLFEAADKYISHNGDLHVVECLWADSHTTGSREAACFDPGSRGPHGGYKCLHGHCQGRNARDVLAWFVAKLGVEKVNRHCGRYTVEFSGKVVIGRPVFPITEKKKDGTPYVVQDRRENTAALLDHYGIRGKYNRMTHRVEWACGEDRWTEQTAFDEIAEAGRRHGYRPTQTVLEQHLRAIVAGNEYHPARDWIASKPWDGVSRFDKFASTLCVAKGFDRVLAETMLRKFLTSAVAAAYTETGVKAEHVLILSGPQGIRKTTWFANLAPFGMVKTGAHFQPGVVDSLRQNTTSWITEWGEAKHTMTRANAEQMKAFLSDTEDVYRMPYGRVDERFPRMTVFCGSENNQEFLVDATGNRRFWIIPVVWCHTEHGLDMQQVWAEIKAGYDAGYTWWMDSETEKAVSKINESHMTSNPIVDALEALYELDPTGETWTPQSEILSQVMADSGASWSNNREGRVITTALQGWASSAGLGKRKSNGARLWPVKARERQTHNVAPVDHIRLLQMAD